MSEPTEQTGTPDGTIPKQQIPIQISQQTIPIADPSEMANLVKLLSRYEGDAIKQLPGGEWVYLRTRAFIDLEKLKAEQAPPEPPKAPLLLGPGGEPVSA